MRRYRLPLLFSILFTALLVGLSLPVTTAQVPTYGTNWTGDFYNGTDLTNSTLVATASYPNGFNNIRWEGQPTDGNGNLLTAVPADNFSAIFRSSQPFQAGIYTFSVLFDDQVTIFVDNTRVYSAPFGQPDTVASFSLQFQATRNYEIRIEFVEFTSVAILDFSWVQGSTAVPPGGGGGVVTTPGAITTPGTPGPVGPIGNVVNVRGLSLRTGPYLGASFIGVLRPDIAYSVLASNADEGGGFTWYKVNTGEQIGWASGRYLVVTNGTPPPESTVFESLINPPSTGVVAVPRAVMNFRLRPSVRSARIGQIPWGAQTELLGRTVQGGQSFWFLVRYNGQVGWIFAPFVGVRGNVGAVPVY